MFIFPTNVKQKNIMYDFSNSTVYVGWDGGGNSETLSNLSAYLTVSGNTVTILDDKINYYFQNGGMQSINVDGVQYSSSYNTDGYSEFTPTHKFLLTGNNGGVTCLYSVLGMALDYSGLSSGGSSVDLTQYFLKSALPDGYGFTPEGVFIHPMCPELPAVISLNGVGCEFMDGVKVNVNGRETVYSVVRSSFFLLDDATYTVLYELSSPTGETLNCPETLLSRYVPVTTP